MLDSGESEHSVTIAVTRNNKPLNRFANIVVCKLYALVLQLQTILIHSIYITITNGVALMVLPSVFNRCVSKIYFSLLEKCFCYLK